jgi:hypothetical protein
VDKGGAAHFCASTLTLAVVHLCLTCFDLLKLGGDVPHRDVLDGDAVFVHEHSPVKGERLTVGGVVVDLDKSFPTHGSAWENGRHSD